jgi:hypothetical protein
MALEGPAWPGERRCVRRGRFGACTGRCRQPMRLVRRRALRLATPGAPHQSRRPCRAPRGPRKQAAGAMGGGARLERAGARRRGSRLVRAGSAADARALARRAASMAGGGGDQRLAAAGRGAGTSGRARAGVACGKLAHGRLVDARRGNGGRWVSAAAGLFLCAQAARAHASPSRTHQTAAAGSQGCSHAPPTPARRELRAVNAKPSREAGRIGPWRGKTAPQCTLWLLGGGCGGTKGSRCSRTREPRPAAAGRPPARRPSPQHNTLNEPGTIKHTHTHDTRPHPTCTQAPAAFFGPRPSSPAPAGPAAHSRRPAARPGRCAHRRPCSPARARSPGRPRARP